MNEGIAVPLQHQKKQKEDISKIARGDETDIQETKIIYEDCHNRHRAALGSGEHKCSREDERERRF